MSYSVVWNERGLYIADIGGNEGGKTELVVFIVTLGVAGELVIKLLKAVAERALSDSIRNSFEDLVTKGMVVVAILDIVRRSGYLFFMIMSPLYFDSNKSLVVSRLNKTKCLLWLIL